MAAVGSSTASEDRASGHPATPGPIRTCIGCRKRAAAAELLRVVVAFGANGQDLIGPAGVSARGPEVLPVVPDPRHRAPGRGAWLHPEPGCVELAERRRAFARALRAPGPVDPAPVRVYVSERPGAPTSGTPQE
jgi:predicted RNA-binding protein YlxR (DUF448 family)